MQMRQAAERASTTPPAGVKLRRQNNCFMSFVFIPEDCNVADVSLFFSLNSKKWHLTVEKCIVSLTLGCVTSPGMVKL